MTNPGDGTSAAALLLSSVTKTYPGVVALADVSLSFNAGEVHAILGENGAGKSTLIKAIAGAIVPDSGTITVAGTTHREMTPAAARAAGIEVIYQEFNLVPTLSVAENICLGEYGGWRADFGAMRHRARELLDELGVAIDPETLVRDLPSSQQQLVEIAKALAKRPRILIMDEPTAPLSVAEVESLFRMVRKARDGGACILYISHRMDEIFALADRVSVLRDGRQVGTLAIGDTDRDGLIRLMVGRTLSDTYPSRPAPTGEVALEVRSLSGNGSRDISFSLHRGEILGVAGLVGAGRTEMAKVIFGAAKLESGEVLLDGKRVAFRTPTQAIAAGIGLIPENRKEEGCFLDQSIRWNISIAALKRITRSLLVDRKAEQGIARQYFDRLRVKAPSLEQRVGNLSGGNQQKVVIAKTLAGQSRVMIFDEPTRGIDVGARAEIYRLMTDLAAEGIAILMITSDMEELLGMSDRILVLHEGRVTGMIPREGATQETVLALASSSTESLAA